MISRITILITCVFLLIEITTAQSSSNRNILFDNDWHFYRGKDSTAFEANYNHSKWRSVDLPHDWSIENMPGTNSPFSAEAINGVSVGFTTGGTGWYRKTFTVPAAQKGKRITITFDGVYMNSDVWVNGKHVGNHPYGYTGFTYDITDFINWDGKNLIAVEVKNEGKNSRWYSGSGIYRHVWLNYLNPLHITQHATAITTPNITKKEATVHIKTTISSSVPVSSSVRLVAIITDHKGVQKARKELQQSLPPNSTIDANVDLNISSPNLWSINNPVLYNVKLEVYQNNRLTDVTNTPFGIRSITFDAVNGFQLNGETVKLKGGCVHHDHGALGAKSYDRAEERKIQLLKASGYNAVRTSHNPPSPAFLDACDRLGMLVIDEAFDTWNERKNKEDYHLYFNDWWKLDVQSMIDRDRNHPSIIMWSIGNEIPNRTKPAVAEVANMIATYVRQLDATRPVTAGVNGIDQNPDAFLAALDVAGYNYAEANYECDHEKFPNRVMYGSESFPLEAYDYWMDVVDIPWVIGDFVWTAFDYIGEASIGWLGYPQSKNIYPWNLAYCGDIDVCGWKRPQSYYRDALWKKNQLSLFVKPPKPTFPEWNEKLEKWSKWNWEDVVADWTWPGYEDTLMNIVVYSSCEEVELFLGNKSLGKQPTNRAPKYRADWQVPYSKGLLKVVGYTDGKLVNTAVLQTAAKQSQVKMTADRNTIKANNHDLSYVTVELVDDKGNRNPKADALVNFSIEGPGEIVGVANANPKSTESFQQHYRKAWQGRCQVIIKAGNKPGIIKLRATSEGMKPAIILITTKKQ